MHLYVVCMCGGGGGGGGGVVTATTGKYSHCPRREPAVTLPCC